MQARFYAPWYGRFLSPDPARDQHFEETQSWNIYSYVRNNPTMNIDPDGQQSVGAQMRMRAEYEEGFAARAKADTRKFIFFTGAVGLTAATAPAWLPAVVPTLFAASNSPGVKQAIEEGLAPAPQGVQAAARGAQLLQSRVAEFAKLETHFDRTNVVAEVEGGLAGAIRYTAETGIPIKGTDHLLKGAEAVQRFEKFAKQVTNSASIPASARQELAAKATAKAAEIKKALEYAEKMRKDKK